MKLIKKFKIQPNKIGQARIFGQNFIGLDEPNLVVDLRVVTRI